MPNVLVAGWLHPLGRAILDGTPGLSVRYVDEISEASYAPYMAEADAVLIRTQPMSAATIAKGARLKLVSRHGVGYDAVDIAALNARGIALAVCGDVNSTSVAEHAVMMMLASAKHALRADASVRKGPWNWRGRLEALDLRERNLLVLGYGRIGRHTARIAEAIGMKVRAFDPYLMKMGWPEGSTGAVSDLLEGLVWADVISISAPRGDKPLLAAAEFAVMRDGVILINTARGGIVDEAALVDALRSGKVGAAGLDVFDAEPPAPDHPLLSFDNVLLSPHIAGLTAGSTERMATSSAQNIVDFFAGRIDSALVVNKEYVHGTVQA